MASACEKPRNGDPIEIIVINNTKDTTICVLQYTYPDTVILNFKTEIGMTKIATCPPYSSEKYYFNSVGWEYSLREERKTDGIVCIVYSLDTIRKYPFEQIQQDYNILKRHVLSIEQLKAINWTITYP
jgi:hypothetical protein